MPIENILKDMSNTKPTPRHKMTKEELRLLQEMKKIFEQSKPNVCHNSTHELGLDYAHNRR